MLEAKNAYRIFGREISQIERTKRWENNIKVNYREMGLEGGDEWSYFGIMHNCWFGISVVQTSPSENLFFSYLFSVIFSKLVFVVR
jgi:hypothetical protein